MVVVARVFALLFSCKSATSLLVQTGRAGVNDALRANASRGSFIITSGLTSSDELCLAVENGRTGSVGAQLVLEPCAAAIDAGDGREVFSLQPDGQLLNAVGKLCVVLSNGDVNNGVLTLAQCGGAGNVFELEGSGQIKFGREGQYCVSQRGNVAGPVNLALGAAVTATSSVASHGPIQAVNNMGGFWASRPGAGNPVEFILDFGLQAKVESADITWEYPAQSFSIMLLTSDSWTEVFSTSVNNLHKTRVALGGSLATKAKIVMREPHPLHGRLNGQFLYGIAELRIQSNGLQTVVEECSVAGKSADCRDKYFLSYVGEYDPSPASALLGELPGLDAAQTSLSATTAELAEAVSNLASCGAVAASLAVTKSGEGRDASSGAEKGEGRSTFDPAQATELLQEARGMIVQMRSALT